MKKITFILTLCSMAICSCQRTGDNVSSLIAQRDSLIMENQKQREELTDLTTFVETVSSSLDSIAMQESILTLGNRENPSKMTKAQLKENLDQLAEMLERQRNRINMLEDSLRLTKSASNLHKLISYLNKQLDSKEATIQTLKAELKSSKADVARLNKAVSALNEDVQRLGEQNQMQLQALEVQSNMMNECYFKVGSKKQLKSEGILGAGNKLNPAALTSERFSPVDIRKFREMPINAKRCRVLTAMPAGSYIITSNGNGTCTLIIHDAAAFWSVSNYLVIVTE